MSRHVHPQPPPHDLVELRGGPLHGQRINVMRQSKALVFLRAGDDGLTSCTYAGDTTSGQLQHQRTFDRQLKRRPRAARSGDSKR